MISYNYDELCLLIKFCSSGKKQQQQIFPFLITFHDLINSSNNSFCPHDSVVASNYLEVDRRDGVIDFQLQFLCHHALQEGIVCVYVCVSTPGSSPPSVCKSKTRELPCLIRPEHVATLKPFIYPLEFMGLHLHTCHMLINILFILYYLFFLPFSYKH